MSKPLMVGLVLASILTGCKTPVALQAAPIEKEGVVSGSMAKKFLPAGTPTVGPRAKASNPVSALTPRGTGQASALTGAGDLAPGSDGGEAGAPGLSLLETETPSLKLVPILDDNGQLASMMAQPAVGALSWKLKGARGPLTLGSARLVLRREAVQPTLDAAAEPAGPAVGEPMSFDLTLKAVGMSATTRAGTTYTVTLPLTGDEAKAFVLANPTTAQASVTLTLLDVDGNPVSDDKGAPLILTARVTVL